MVDAAGVDAPARESSSASEDLTWVRAIHRFAVKGLDRDVLSSATLRDRRLRDDRRFALIYDEHGPLYGTCTPTDWLFRAALPTFPPRPTDPSTPAWLHKSHFLCAFTAAELLARYRTAYAESRAELSVWPRAAPAGARPRRTPAGFELYV